MSELLPILHPAMKLCQICPKPGRCCSGFILSNDQGSITVWAESWEANAADYPKAHGLPFRPARREGSYWTPSFGEYTIVRFACEHLTSEGRCGIYDTRPEVCRRFVPGESTLCVFGKEPAAQ